MKSPLNKTSKITDMQNQQGFISITALWVLAILVLIAVSFAYQVSLQIKQKGLILDRLQARYEAEAGITMALALLTDPGTAALNREYFTDGTKEMFFADQQQNGMNYTEDMGFQFKIVDEEAKINVNLASRKILENIPGITEEIAAAIIDWRDEDDVLTKNGAESDYYLSLEAPYPCKNSDLGSLEELLLVRGMDHEIFAGIRNWITVHGDGKINLNTASQEVLEIIAFPTSLVQKIIDFRAGLNGVNGDDDDQQFQGLVTIRRALEEWTELTEEESLAFDSVLKQLKIDSRFYTVFATGRFPQADITKEIIAIIETFDKSRPVIRSWYES